MRATPPVSALLGLLAIGGLAAGCGASTQSRTSAARASAPVAHSANPAHIAFLAPAPGARTGSTVLARVTASEELSVRFILDRGRPRIASGLTLTYGHLTPGPHRLIAELLDAGTRRPDATASVRFVVRQPTPKRAARHPVSSVRTPSPASSTPTPYPSSSMPTTPPSSSVPTPPRASSVPTTPPSSSVPMPSQASSAPPHVSSAPAAPPPRPAAPPASSPPAAAPPPAAPSHVPAPPSHAGSGIPQGGGGDGDGDNSGGPSDGDGNV